MEYIKIFKLLKRKYEGTEFINKFDDIDIDRIINFDDSKYLKDNVNVHNSFNDNSKLGRLEHYIIYGKDGKRFIFW